MRFILSLALVTGLLAVGASAEEERARLLAGGSSDARLGIALVDSMGVARSRPIEVDGSAIADLRPGDAVRFDLFPDVSVEGEHSHRETREDGSSYFGSLAGGGSYVISERAGGLFGVVFGADGTYELRPTPGGAHHVVEIDGAALPPCSHPIPQEGGEAGDPAAPLIERGGGCVVIDVLIAYTNDVGTRLGGPSGAESLAQAAVDVTNAAYDASEVSQTPTRLRLVHVAGLDYDESGSYGQQLQRLAGTNDGFMDEVHALRNQHGADMVALLVTSSGACGQAYLMTGNPSGFDDLAFSVTTWSCAVGNLTFAHELGHNMGCAHDRDNAGAAFFSYSYGWRWTPPGDYRRSIMAYSPGNRVGHFSNPSVLDGGQPTGVPIGQPNQAHNAATIGFTTPFIEGYRSQAVTPEDCDGDGLADLCQDGLADCNGNGVFDACDVLNGTSPDCNDNGTPDECDLASGLAEDCDGNGVPDECDVAALDCNGNGVPDACDVEQLEVYDDSGALSPVAGESPQTWTLVNPGYASGDVTLTFSARADLSSSSESIEVVLNSASQGFLFQSGANDCPNEHDQAQLVLGASEFNALLDQGGGDLVIDMLPTFFVDASTCGQFSSVRVETSYTGQAASADDNNDGVPDECQSVPDCTGDLTTTGAGEGDPAYGESDGVTDLSDLLYYVNVWQADLGSPSSNPDSVADTTTTGASEGSPAYGVPDGDVDLTDLLYYVNDWNVGIIDCP